MGKVKRLSVPSSFPFGRQTVGTIKPSTGIYGKLVGGKANNNAVKVRKRRG